MSVAARPIRSDAVPRVLSAAVMASFALKGMSAAARIRNYAISEVRHAAVTASFALKGMSAAVPTVAAR
jgi:hypothetical protein